MATRRRAEELRPLEGRGHRRGLEVAAGGHARREGEGSGLERGRDREGDREKEGGRACVRVSLAAQEDEGTIEGSGCTLGLGRFGGLWPWAGPLEREGLLLERPAAGP